MDVKRKAFQGLTNIFRFNWHFYLLACVAFPFLGFGFGMVLAILILSSLLVSYYIYDHSNLYALPWLENTEPQSILNINAGFDESSAILSQKFPSAALHICDFYNPKKHTEVSVKRARKAYPPNPNCIQVQTSHLPFSDHTFDTVIAMLAAHEIRSAEERAQFFLELNRVSKSGGRIYVTEHLRDFPNLLAYNIGFFHFLSKKSWLETFEAAHLQIEAVIHTTPFITTFILKRMNGNAA